MIILNYYFMLIFAFQMSEDKKDEYKLEKYYKANF